MANIARAPIELELVSAEDIAGRNIREVVGELLNELADRRQNIHGTAEIDALRGSGLHEYDSAVANPRFRALEQACEICSPSVAVVDAARTVLRPSSHNGEGGVR
jgi:hypothetical protein